MDLTTREISKIISVEPVTIRLEVLEDDRELESIHARDLAGDRVPDTLFE